jgi:hypothetical protein
MKIEYRASFVKDIKNLKSKDVSQLITSVIENCEKATTIADIKHCEAL